MRPNDHIWLRLMRDEAWGEQGRRCHYCGTTISRTDATADHVRPRKKNGLDERDNIVAACRPCNQAKGSMTAREFTKMLKGKTPHPNFGAALCAVAYRINRRADVAVKRIMDSVAVAQEAEQAG